MNEANGVEVTLMPPPPPDYGVILAHVYHVLRGTETALQNHGMVPDHLREAVLTGCIKGLSEYLRETLGVYENQVSVILHAVEIQRAVLRL